MELKRSFLSSLKCFFDKFSSVKNCCCRCFKEKKANLWITDNYKKPKEFLEPPKPPYKYQYKFVFQEGEVFYPEDGDCHKTISKYGIKACDFIWRTKENNKPYLYFIEVKSSSPNPNNQESEEAFDKYIRKTVKKFEDSLLMYTAIVNQRLKEDPQKLPELLTQLECLQDKIICLLVIPRHERKWLPQPTRLLQEQSERLRRVFSLKTFVVNCQSAQKDFNITISLCNEGK